jgi:dihydrolipoamide dehydrogenase
MAVQGFDVVIIGGGPGGYVCAIRSAQLGLKTAVVERESLGGVCLNWGCIPTKALLHASDILSEARHGIGAGLYSGSLSANLDAVVGHSRQVAGRLSGGIKYLMDKNGVAVFTGHGSLAGDMMVEVHSAKGDPVTLHAKSIVIATGAKAGAPPGFTPDGKRIVTYRGALTPDRLPKSMLVLGGGVIGMEFASFYNAMGVAVTVAEMADTILAGQDADVVAVVRKQAIKRGIKFALGARARIVGQDDDGIDIVLSQAGKETTSRVEQVLVATGISAVIDELGLERTKVELSGGRIVTDQYCRTAEPGVYAIGDVGLPPWLAHKASHEGIVCAEHMAGKAPHPVDPAHIPGCIFTNPQIASIGLTEAMAAEQGRVVTVGKFPLMANGKALAIGSAEGLVKVIFETGTRKLLGAHMVGPEVTEMIQGFAIAIRMGATIDDLTGVVFPHPTVSEAMHEAVLAADGRALHI